MRHMIALADDVRDVLERSAITETALTLPSGQLVRELYERVDKVLKAAGGKWNRSAKAHVFVSDPRAALGLALETGGIVDAKKAMQQFFTPAGLAAQVVAAASLAPGLRVLEPSAGAGALARAARNLGARVDCIELDAALAVALVEEGYVTVQADFLSCVPSAFQSYDRVIMNPPFENGQDIAHVTHAFGFLKPGGVLLAIMPAGVESNQQAKYRMFRQMVAACDGTIMPLPDGSFDESGTGVRTVLVTLYQEPVYLEGG
jgi:predicted RNA methylase